MTYTRGDKICTLIGNKTHDFRNNVFTFHPTLTRTIAESVESIERLHLINYNTVIERHINNDTEYKSYQPRRQ